MERTSPIEAASQLPVDDGERHEVAGGATVIVQKPWLRDPETSAG